MGFLSSLSAFATTGVQDCKSLLGSYSCNYEGQNVDFLISKNTEVNSIKISINGEGQDFILDGTSHNSTVDSSQNITECKEKKEIVIDNFFHGELKGSFSVLKTANGIKYTMIQAKGSSVELDCIKK